MSPGTKKYITIQCCRSGAGKQLRLKIRKFELAEEVLRAIILRLFTYSYFAAQIAKNIFIGSTARPRK